MSKFIHKSHNVSVQMYHIVCPAKYRRVVFSEAVDQKLKETCLEISKRYEITFLEIGTVGKHGNESVIKQYIQSQGAESHYERLYEEQLNLF